MTRFCTCLGFGIVALAAVACSDDESTSSQGGTPAQGGDGGVLQGGGGTGGSAGGGGEAGMGGECVNSLPNEMTPPLTLGATGLYADIALKTLAPEVQEFAPQFELWSDDAAKTRWVYLPECGIIDNSDEDNWELPVGTRMWKEFVVNGTLVETRLIHRWGPDQADFIFAAYQWNGTDSEADLVDPLNGQVDAKGTTHDIPNEDSCRRCHGPHPMKGGTPSHFLGFGALQLSHAGSGVTMATLSNDNLLTAPNAAGYTVPGTQVEVAALGYLHANCGNCHNDTLNGILYPFFDARVKAGDATVADTAVYSTVVNQMTDFYTGHGCDYRIAGNSIANSCIHQRMNTRGNTDQMPPLASEVVDTDGVAIMEAWIPTLPPPP